MALSTLKEAGQLKETDNVVEHFTSDSGTGASWNKKVQAAFIGGLLVWGR